ncbi:MAG TPA: GFA family protein [Hypericibacter adhaerens]|jgi:hypothetical protein|uniref:Aldehyde-activating protein n=1 Tax=Hypericibacter adhaerens TaxID=2602016 RepID=A0A5J6N396_9PROT|nr:GFA family protein [Hypericibacter adhaerens]QEX24472.1 aldehyde-activating protein [Hypericibacter adhaerens]HWA41703.1 GFA family protein [Hypericibacter adhaerens]
MAFRPAEGGCLCGAVRYRIDAEPKLADICHCSMCRKSAGAPFIAWIAVPHTGFHWTKGEPAAYRSSKDATRYFCGRCGSQLMMRGGSNAELDGVLIGSLDEPARFVPTAEGWASVKLPWVKLGLPLESHPKDNPAF